MSQQRAKDSTPFADESHVRDTVDSRRGPPSRTTLSGAPPTTCVSASHSILFEDEGSRCGVCSEPLDADEDDESTAIRGCGLLVWARGEERRYEEPQLCPSCAAAIGVSALQRWEIEEDEG